MKTFDETSKREQELAYEISRHRSEKISMHIKNRVFEIEGKEVSDDEIAKNCTRELYKSLDGERCERIWYKKTLILKINPVTIKNYE